MTTVSLVHTVRPPADGANAPGERPPLLVLLHGVGANERQMAQLAPAFDPRFIVVSARSPLTLGPDSFAWFHVTFTPQGPVLVTEELEAGWALLARFIDEAVAEYDADPARVYVAGFSQGAIMALALSLTSPEKVAGVVAMSGRLPPEVLAHAAPPERLAGKSALIVHGATDDKLGVHLARAAREQLERLPIALTYLELGMGHTITKESLTAVADWLAASIRT